MKHYAPEYYPKFRCIAGACRHSCCIGWEIDIDEATREAYRSVGGALGRRLAEEIEDGDPPHFRLTADERCPFLRKDGLCTLILELGEESLCEICTLHPRFRNFFSDRVEVGVGLCCEAASDLILTHGGEVDLIPVGGDEEEAMPLTASEQALFALRAELIALTQSSALTLEARMSALLTAVGTSLPAVTMAEWQELFLSLERLEEAWSNELMKLGEKTAPLEPAWDAPFANLLVYFLYRHLPGALDCDEVYGAMAARTAFAVLSVQIIRAIFAAGERSMASLSEIARLYSAEIEYSEENMNCILSRLERR